MGDIRDLPAVSSTTGVVTPLVETLDDSQALEETQQSFDDALEDGREMNESQTRETRKAIKRSLDRFQTSSRTDAASGSSETDSADASRDRSTRDAADGPTAADDGGDVLREPGALGSRMGVKRSLDRSRAAPGTDGSSGSSGIGSADVLPGGSTRATADGSTDGGDVLSEPRALGPRMGVKRSLDRSRAAPGTDGSSGSSGIGSADVLPGGSTRVTADGSTPAQAGGGETTGLRTSDRRMGIERPPNRFQASRGADGASGSRGAESAGASRDGSIRTAAGGPSAQEARDRSVPTRRIRGASDSGEEDSVAAHDRLRRSDRSSPPVGDEGSRGARAASMPSTNQSAASVDRGQASGMAEEVSVPGRTRAGSAVAAAGARTTPASGRQAAHLQPPRGPSVARTERSASDSRADDTHLSDNTTIDMTGVASSAVMGEAGQTSAPEGVPATTSRAAELAEQVADRILVSMPEAGAAGEVRISLKQSILDGSEVRVFHEGGDLKVVFVAETESAQRFLADNGALMQRTLEERLQEPRVRVEVEAPNSGWTSREDNHGRSRQRYVREDDAPDAG